MPAPAFTLKDFKGETVSLSDFTGKFNVLLVFNRGFT
jgi:peroxiredoxin